MIKAGFAYVDQQSAEEIRENRGTLTAPGKDSPWRDHPIEEHLKWFKIELGISKKSLDVFCLVWFVIGK